MKSVVIAQRARTRAQARAFLRRDTPCRNLMRSGADTLCRVLQEEGFELERAHEQVFVKTPTGYASRTTLRIIDPIGTGSVAAVRLELGLDDTGTLRDSAVMRLEVMPAIRKPSEEDRLHRAELVASPPVTAWASRDDGLDVLAHGLEASVQRMGCAMDDDTARRYALILSEVFRP